ncbi:hypothetical protein ILYODFUR_017880 [Ilyodon furcidens]|uniref:Uncharacterized protein n=1 Tax=Ilyodon furcidens TaxID=33524 RepID=A0ABV0U7K4_9TELE
MQATSVSDPKVATTHEAASQMYLTWELQRPLELNRNVARDPSGEESTKGKKSFSRIIQGPRRKRAENYSADPGDVSSNNLHQTSFFFVIWAAITCLVSQCRFLW